MSWISRIAYASTVAGRGLRMLLVAVVVAILVVSFYDRVVQPGGRPDGLLALAGLAGVIVAALVEGAVSIVGKARGSSGS